MKILAITFGLFAVILAAPADIPADSDGLVSVVQSSDGSYTLDVNLRDYGRKEERLVDGTVMGEYSIPDASGIPQTFKYIAGKDGFRILEGPLPVAPVDPNHSVLDLNVPVASEASEFVPVINEGPRILPNNIFIPNFNAPSFLPQAQGVLDAVVPPIFNPNAQNPVEDTPEVKAARAEHLAAYNQVLRTLV